MARIQIKTDGICAHLFIDGQDVSDIVTGYQLIHRAGEVPTLQLSLCGLDVSVEEKGTVQFPERIRRFLDEWKRNHSKVEDISTDAQATAEKIKKHIDRAL